MKTDKNTQQPQSGLPSQTEQAATDNNQLTTYRVTFRHICYKHDFICAKSLEEAQKKAESVSINEFKQLSNEGCERLDIHSIELDCTAEERAEEEFQEMLANFPVQ